MTNQRKNYAVLFLQSMIDYKQATAMAINIEKTFIPLHQTSMEQIWSSLNNLDDYKH